MRQRVGPRQLRNASVAERAMAQHGVLSRSQAVGLGLSPAAIARRLSSGQWVRVLPRVYRFAAAPETHAQHLAACALWAGDEAVLSHRTALSLWGHECHFDSVDVLTPERRDPRPGMTVHQVRRLPANHVRVHNGFPVTSPERTLLDIATFHGHERWLEDGIQTFLRLGLITINGLAAFIRHPSVRGLPGRRPLAKALRGMWREEEELDGPEFYIERMKRFVARERLTPLDENIPIGNSGVVLPLGYKNLKLAVIWSETELPWPAGLKRALQKDGYQVFSPRVVDMKCDPEWEAFKLSSAVYRMGGEPCAPWRKLPSKRPWIERNLRSWVRFARQDWFEYTVRSSNKLNWDSWADALPYCPDARRGWQADFWNGVNEREEREAYERDACLD